MNLYTYGSLRLQKIWAYVVGRTFETRTAVVADHVALKVIGESYPGLVARPGEQTTGLVYLDVDTASLRTLDLFEGDFYERVPITARLENGDHLECDAYRVHPANHNLLLEERWDFDEFRRSLAEGFIDDYVK